MKVSNGQEEPGEGSDAIRAWPRLAARVGRSAKPGEPLGSKGLTSCQKNLEVLRCPLTYVGGTRWHQRTITGNYGR
jgi:hypothetical protein